MGKTDFRAGQSAVVQSAIDRSIFPKQFSSRWLRIHQDRSKGLTSHVSGFYSFLSAKAKHRGGRLKVVVDRSPLSNRTLQSRAHQIHKNLINDDFMPPPFTSVVSRTTFAHKYSCSSSAGMKRNTYFPRCQEPRPTRSYRPLGRRSSRLSVLL